jgi:2-hydroxycyclohexanecarboxyl-CoA dehydrogenase
MMRGLEGRAVIVTGGGSGIGRAICERLADAGANVSILDINLENANTVVRELKARGVKAHAEQVDISDYVAVKRATAGAEAALGPTELLVNCAGWDKVTRFLDTDPALHDKVIAINLKGPTNVMHVVVRGMAERGFGRVVSITSDAGRVGSSGQAVYSACKAGIIAMSKTLAREFAKQGISFNSVAPGPTRTPMMEAALQGGDGEESVKILEKMGRAVPMGRIGEPEDLAGITCFLISDEARFITGQVISVSGGLVMNG